MNYSILLNTLSAQCFAVKLFIRLSLGADGVLEVQNNDIDVVTIVPPKALCRVGIVWYSDYEVELEKNIIVGITRECVLHMKSNII